MFGMTDLIVTLWLLPVTLYVAVPLGMLCAWSIIRLAKKMTSAVTTAIAQRVRADEHGSICRAHVA